MCRPEWAHTQVALGDGEPASDGPQREGPDVAALLSHFKLMRPLPLGVLDLSGDAPEFEVFRETYRRADVPVIQPIGIDGSLEQPSLWQVVELAMTLGQNLAELTTQAQRANKTRYGGDAGWNQVWKSISVKSMLW